MGSSTAKGLCFGAGIPLITVSTPDILVLKAISEGLVPEGCTAIVPMIDARSMAPLATKKFEAGEFEDTAYFEPFYIKDYVATVSRKKLW